MSSSVQPLSDPGGVRTVTARWVITADLVTQSATHFGGTEGDAADMVLLRDPRDGSPLLPGTSLAGTLRSHLADVLGGYRRAEDRRVTVLFGGGRGDELGDQSPLIVFDSLGAVPQGLAAEIRDGVAIDPKTGTAEERKKFDVEVLPPGTRFPLRVELVVTHHPGREAELLRLVLASLGGLTAGELSLGARRSRGYGAVQAENWRARRFDLTTADGWIAWLLSDHEHPIPEPRTGLADAETACRIAWPGQDIPRHEDHRRRIVVKANLKVKSSVLVRSAPQDPDAPDAVHLRSGGQSVLPGTSLAGVLRARALRIAHVVRAQQGDAERWVSDLFGPRLEGTTARKNDGVLFSARLRVAESPVENGVRQRPSRIRIDRFTQGVCSGALFDEEPDYGGDVRVRIELRDPQPGEGGLLLLVLKDLLSGDLPVGGSAAVGRGVLEGTGEVRWEDGRPLKLDPRRQPDSLTLDQLNGAIRTFHEASMRGGTP